MSYKSKISKRILLFICVFLLWFLCSRNSNELFLPKPESVMSSLIEMAKSGTLFLAIVYSLRRILIATCLSAAMAYPLGLLAYNYTIIYDVIGPLVNLMRYLPVTAFYPLLIMYFGIEERMKIAFLFIATFVYMMPSVMLALDEINGDLIDTGLTIGMTKWQTITLIQIPATLPSILNSFVMMIGIGFTYIATVESVNAVYGLGYIIQQSSARGRTDLVFMSIIVLIVISILIDSISKWSIKKLFKWRYVND